MKHFQILFAALMFTATIGLAVPAQAKIVVNVWEPIEAPVIGDPCAGEDALVQGMVHTTVATLKNGQFAIHVNTQGVVTGLDTGREWLWRRNIADVLPVDDGNLIWTIRDSDKIIGRGGLPSLFINYKFHVTVISGDVKVYFESETYGCSE